MDQNSPIFKFGPVFPFIHIFVTKFKLWTRTLIRVELDHIQKYWTKLKGSGRILLALNPACLQYLVGFSNRSYQKVINA